MAAMTLFDYLRARRRRRRRQRARPAWNAPVNDPTWRAFAFAVISVAIIEYVFLMLVDSAAEAWIR
jgi:hypothetical protein